MFTVGRVAELAGITVRTLHHYDEIGLLSPTGGRSTGGYRVYTDADIERLARVLYYRELGFPLDQIATLMTESDSSGHLREQHRLLRRRRDRVTAMLAELEKEMEALDMGISLTPEERLEIFGEHADKVFGDGEYAVEAKQRWGDTDAWKESDRRTKAYTKQDWVEIKGEADANIQAFAQAMRAREPADGTVAMDLAEAHRAHIDRWFYPCSYEMHVGLADMYVSDERFTATYDEIEPGMSIYVGDAIRANAARHAA